MATKPKRTAALFAQWCRLTCLGGSERGECPCKSPNDCELRGHYLFEGKRQEARERMVRAFDQDTGRALLEIGPVRPKGRIGV